MRKKILIGAGILLGVLVLGIFGLSLMLNPLVKRLQPQIVARASELVGQPVQFESVTGRIFPSTRLELKKATIGANSVGQVDLHLALLPLLGGEVRIEKLSVEDAQIQLQRTADGQISVGGVPLARRSPETAPTASDESTKSPMEFAVREILLKEISVSFRNDSVPSAPKVSIAGINGSVSNFGQDTPASIDIAAQLLSDRRDNIRLKGEVNLLRLLQPQTEGSIVITVNDLDTAELERLLVAYGALESGGQWQGRASAELAVRPGAPLSLRPKLDFTDVSLAWGSTKRSFVKPAGVPFSLTGELSFQSPDLTVPQLQFTLGDSSGRISGKVPSAGKKEFTVEEMLLDIGNLASFVPSLAAYAPRGIVRPAFTAVLDEGNPRLHGSAMLEKVGAEVKRSELPPLALTDFSGPVNFENDSVSAKGITGQIAQQPIEVGAKVVSLAQPVAAFYLKTNAIQIAPVAKSFVADPSPFGEARATELQVNGTYSTAKREGKVDAKIGTLRLAGRDLSAIAVSAELLPTGIKLNPSSLRVGGGSLSAEGLLRQTKEFQLSLQGQGIQLGEILRDAKKGITGTVQSLTLATTGSTGAIPNSLTGPIKATVVGGSLQGVNIVGEALKKAEVIPGVSESLLKYVSPEALQLLTGDSTPFDTLSLDAGLSNGGASVTAIRLQHSLYIITASGRASFAGTADLRAQLRLTPTLVAPMVSRQPRLKLLLDREGNLSFPVAISRSDGSTLVLPDVSELAKNAARNAAKEAAGKALDKVAPGLGGATDLLDSLLK